MLTRRYKKYKHTRAHAAQQCQEVKALLLNITLTCEQSMAKCWLLSSEESVEKCHSVKQHLTMSMDHLGNGAGLSRLHEVLMRYMSLPKLEWTPYCFWDVPDLKCAQILTQTSFGSPFQYGDWFFWCFFSHAQDRFSRQKLRQSQRQRRMMLTRRTSKEEAAAATAGCHASSAATASNSSLCRLG